MLLARIMGAAVDLANAEQASILLYDQHAQKLYFEAATNKKALPLLQKTPVPLESIAGWVALHQTTQVVNNVHQDERHFQEIDPQVQFVPHSMIALPLVSKQKLIGILEVLNKKTGNFDEDDKEILEALAALAAGAIETSRMFQQSNLVAEFVHELRTPMSSLFAASHLLQHPDIAPEQRIRLAQTIQQETQRLNELASLFLDLASLESGRASLHYTKFPPASLLDECQQVAQIKASEKGIQVHLEIPEPLPDLEADRDKIKQVLLNLLNNAVKYNREQGQVWIRAWIAGQDIFFSIRDNGVGIPQDQISQLFTRFFRARNVEHTVSGTGLGLSICQSIIETHGGEIQVESKLNTGTIFTIRLPLAHPLDQSQH